MFKLMEKKNSKQLGKGISIMSKMYEPKSNFIKIAVLVMLMFAPFITQAQTVYFEDNFDSYTAGQRLVGQATGTAWRTWSNNTPNKENPYVRDDQAETTPNSVKIENDNDLYFPFANFKNGKYSIEFDYYVVSTGNGAYFNIQHKTTSQGAPGEEWAFGVYFYNNGNGYLTVDEVDYNFSYGAANTWFHIYMEIDLENDQASLTINNSLVNTWQFSLQENGNDEPNNQLGGVNLYAGCPDNSKKGTYYIDNFKVVEMLGVAPGIFGVSSDDQFGVILDAGQTATKTFTLTNTGGSDVNYRVVPTYYPETPSTQTGTPEEILYYVGDLDDSTIDWSAIRFNAEEYTIVMGLSDSFVKENVGKKITKFQVGLLKGSLATSATVQVFRKDFEDINYIPALEPIYEQKFTPQTAQGNYFIVEEITLNTPVIIDGGGLWVGVKITQPTPVNEGENVPAFLVDNINNGNNLNENSNFVKINTGWNRLTTRGNMFMSAVVGGVQVVPGKWITATPSSGLLAPGETANVTVTFGGP